MPLRIFSGREILYDLIVSNPFSAILHAVNFLHLNLPNSPMLIKAKRKYKIHNLSAIIKQKSLFQIHPGL